MRTDIYTESHGIETILVKMEKVGQLCGLSASETGKLRLLTEEMLTLTVRLFDNLSYEFFAESSEKQFKLSLTAATRVSQSDREKLLSVSKSGKNKATQGVFGKISGIFESLVMESCDYEQLIVPTYDSMGLMPYFVLSSYRDEIPKLAKEEQDEMWDGLEKSIIATLAKDVIIGVRSSKVEMVVLAEF